MTRPYIPYSLRSRRHRRRENRGKPESERNIPAAFFSLVVAGIFAVAMAEPNWLSIHGGRCNNQHIGLYKIFGIGSQRTSEKTLKDVYCMNKNVVFEMKLIASCCILGMVFSLLQFALDTWGTAAKGFRVIRKNATGDILAVLLCVTAMIVSYMVVLEVENNEVKTGEVVKVTLDVAFYLMIGAGVNAVIATTLNLLQCTCEKRDGDSESEMMMELMYDDLQVDHELPPFPPAYDL